MSKSKGNVIDPIDLIDGISLDDLLKKRTQGLMQPQKAAAIAAATKKDFPQGLMSYGADALRLTFCQQASPGRFIRFDTQRMQTSHNFCNKLWNMMRFTLMQLEDRQPYGGDFKHPVHLWIIKQLQSIQEYSRHQLASYRFDLLAQGLVDFAWTTICDQYLEFAKVLLKDSATRAEAQSMLHRVISAVLQLLHPIMPFITEELSSVLHQHTNPESPYTMLVLQEAIKFDKFDEETSVQELLELITVIRTVRSKLDVAPKALVSLVIAPQANVARLWKQFQPFIQELGKVDSVNHELSASARTVSAALNEESFSLILPELVVDVTVQQERLLIDRQKYLKEIEKAEQKLSNEAFTSKAPVAVVEQERQRLAEFKVQLASLEESLAQLKIKS